MNTDTTRLQQAVAHAAGERMEGKVVGEKEADAHAEVAFLEAELLDAQHREEEALEQWDLPAFILAHEQHRIIWKLLCTERRQNATGVSDEIQRPAEEGRRS